MNIFQRIFTIQPSKDPLEKAQDRKHIATNNELDAKLDWVIELLQGWEKQQKDKERDTAMFELRKKLNG